jgi:hypothetical protein
VSIKGFDDPDCLVSGRSSSLEIDESDVEEADACGESKGDWPALLETDEADVRVRLVTGRRPTAGEGMMKRNPKDDEVKVSRFSARDSKRAGDMWSFWTFVQLIFLKR